MGGMVRVGMWKCKLEKKMWENEELKCNYFYSVNVILKEVVFFGRCIKLVILWVDLGWESL